MANEVNADAEIAGFSAEEIAEQLKPFFAEVDADYAAQFGPIVEALRTRPQRAPAMGYETSIDLYDVRVQPDKRTEVADAIAAHKRGEGQHHWMVGSLKIGSGGALTWDDAHIGKWKSHEEFIGDLASWCSRGWVSFWSREGDGAAWAYEFDGAGGHLECSARRVAAFKAAATRKRRAAGAKAALTKKRKAAGRKAAATRRARQAEPGAAADGGA